jgi:hypothetical protein
VTYGFGAHPVARPFSNRRGAQRWAPRLPFRGLARSAISWCRSRPKPIPPHRAALNPLHLPRCLQIHPAASKLALPTGFGGKATISPYFGQTIHCALTSRPRPSFRGSTGGPCRAADASPQRAASRCEIEAQSRQSTSRWRRRTGRAPPGGVCGDHDTAYRQSTSRWRRRTGRAPPGGVWSPLLPVDLVPPSPMATARATGRVRVGRPPAPRLPRGNKHVPRSGRPSAAR